MGNTAIFDIMVTEGEFSGTGEMPDSVGPADPSVLNPGDSVECTATYVATQADVDAAEDITNDATTSGTTPAGNPVLSPSSDTDEITKK